MKKMCLYTKRTVLADNHYNLRLYRYAALETAQPEKNCLRNISRYGLGCFGHPVHPSPSADYARGSNVSARCACLPLREL